MAPPLPGEFSLIARHFRRLAGPGSLDLADDAAVFDPPPGRQLVAAADAVVEDVHFLPDDPPDTIGRKLLRVNLSDLAAMGAAPLGYLLTVALPRVRDFRGLNPRSFDGRGNYAMGIKEHIVFPEINYDKVDSILGMDIIVCTTAKTDNEARALLRAFNFPFRQ